MKADLTRDSYNVLKHYSQVLMQQGRVQLDADWNEQGRILLHQLRAAVADMIGPAGGRASAEWPNEPGFAVLPLAGAIPPHADFLIANGRYYVDGIMCELNSEAFPVTVSLDGKSVVVQRWTIDGRSFAAEQYVRVWNGNPGDGGNIAKIAMADHASLTLTLDPAVAAGGPEAPPQMLQRMATYRTQQDFAGVPPGLPNGGRALVYLDVWERVVTMLEDPAIREIALGFGGSDTAARVRTIAQVRVLPNMEICIPPDQIANRVALGSPGLLRAQALPATSSTDPCTIDPDTGYRGPENQLYRVEIHSGGNKTPSFKWSRENGSVLFQVQSITADTGIVTVTLANLGRDDRFGLSDGDYVELQSERTVLNIDVPPAPLLQVKSIDRDTRRVMLTNPSGGSLDTTPFAATLFPVLRRWDHKGEVGADNALRIPLTAAQGGNDWIDLEDAVQVQFAPLTDVNYRSGDYWLIPARVATGSVIWPQDTWTDPKGVVQSAPALRSPDGVRHHYAPLAVIELSPTTAPVVTTSCQVQLGARVL